ncbi:hypothetical protein B0O79_0203 [Flavobacteriaceae bacterium MAR_2009_75]|nr:hypothetical protein B0O79_0203 [Flavobacteriaceae bacterium MAR_2009_75]
MRILLVLSFILVSIGSWSQDSEVMEVQNTIEKFFDGFHAQDSVQIKQTVSDSIIIQTIAMDDMDNPMVKSKNLNEFLKSIVAIPKSTKFEEAITNYSIQIDGPMANAWTDYKFYLDGKFHHCGVNSFQLIKDLEKGWQIIYVIDTRRKTNCI